MKKRGQLTFFIIVGVIILLLVGIAFYTFYIDLKDKPIDEPTVTLDQFTMPVNQFVESCVYDLSKDALNKLMERGGYLYNDNLYYDVLDSTEGNSLDYIPGSTFLIPYWYHMESDNECMNDCIFGSMRKELCKPTNTECFSRGENSIEHDLERYLEENLNKCLNDFKNFEEENLIVINESNPDFDIIIRKNSILINLNFPLTIIQNEHTSRISNFNVEYETALYELYEAATEITNYQSTNCIFENHILNLISIYSGLEDEFDLPPFYMESPFIRNRVWFKPEVHNSLDELASAYIPLIRFRNTSQADYPISPIENPLFEGIHYHHFLFSPFKKQRDIIYQLNFFPWWETYFDIPQAEGNLISSRETLSFRNNPLERLIGRINNAEYISSYRYSFPVVIELRKPGYDFDLDHDEIFRFALEGNIRANKCFMPGEEIIRPAVRESLLCNPLFFSNDEYNISVRDDYTNELIEDVEIEFYLEQFCMLGRTNENGYLVTNMPSTEGGGYITFSKEGYLDKFINLSEYSNYINVKLKPLFEKEIKISMLNLSTINEMGFSDNPFDIREQNKEEINSSIMAVVSFTREQESYKDPEYEHSILISDDLDISQTLQFARGRYNFEIILIIEQEVILPEERNKFCMDTSITGSLRNRLANRLGIRSLTNCEKVPVNSNCEKPSFCDPWPLVTSEDDADLEHICFIESDCYIDGFECKGYCDVDEDIIFPEIVLPSFIYGGLIINETNSLYNMNDYNILNNTNTIEFYVINQGLPERTSTMADLVDKYEYYSMDFGYLLRPKLISN